MNLIHHPLHDLHEGAVLGGVDNKAGSVARDRQKVGVDFAANSGSDLAPGFRAEQIAPDRDLLHFNFDPKLLEGGRGSGQDDDFAGNWSKLSSFEKRNPMAGKTLGSNRFLIEKYREV